ncbi:MAG TPA: NUDIX hydrolase [Actinomycetales bacterium]|jgi:8-oxo-dGTP pyrophosphatase MutT (NUDIX family)
MTSSEALVADAVAALEGYASDDGGQRVLRTQYLTHLREHDGALFKDGPPAHLTASCFVLDDAAEQVLLTLHRKGGFWVQLGGHVERGDASLSAAALREATEESGLAGITLLPGPVELHRHQLSAAFGRCLEHLDVAYAATAGGRPVVSDESDDVAWWPVDALPATAVPDLVTRLPGIVRAVRADQSVRAGPSSRAPSGGARPASASAGTGWREASDQPSR